MKNEEIFREIFINNTLRLVSEGGFESATTRAISGERREVNNVKVNEAHIYRIYGKKEHLFAEIFAMLDCELLAAVKAGLDDFANETDPRKQWENMFYLLWDFVMQREDRCKYYIRYYYSVYFTGESLRAHTSRFRDFVCDMMPYFVEKADVCAILQHVVTVVLSFATCVYNGTLENTEKNISHVFTVVYASLAPSFR